VATIRGKPRRGIVAALLDVVFDEAVKFATSRNVTLPSVYYTELQDEARAHAFTVSHLASLGQIGQVFDALNETMRDGGTFADFTKLVEADGIEFDKAHRETVFRNAVQTGYNAGRRQQQIENEENRQYLIYDAINDSRTRPSHRAMDGFIAPVGHPVWQRWYPPCGHNCRCSVISLTEAQAKARGYTGRVREPSVEPDEGFGSDPGARKIAQRLGAAVVKAGAKLPAKVRRAAGKYVIRAARKKA
jgi:SPP1 gp7 family putative phage head morphogenesis protein